MGQTYLLTMVGGVHLRIEEGTDRYSVVIIESDQPSIEEFVKV